MTHGSDACFGTSRTFTMDVPDVLSFFFKCLDQKDGVDVQVADWDPETGRWGIGIGMSAVRKIFLHESKPLLVLGVSGRDELEDRGFRKLLELPCVRYVELPCATDTLTGSAAEIAETTASEAALTEVRVEATRDAINRLNRNVTHTLEGGIVGTLKNVRDAVLVAANAAIVTSECKAELQEFAASMDFFRNRLGTVLIALAREIKGIEGVAGSSVLDALGEIQAGLSRGMVALQGSSRGIMDWAKNGLPGTALAEVLLEIEAFSKARGAAVIVFEKLLRGAVEQRKRPAGRLR